MVRSMKKKYIEMILGTAILGAAITVTAGAVGTEMEARPGSVAGTEMEFNLPEEKLVRNEEGRIVGVDVSDMPVAAYENYTLKELLDSEQFKEYEKLGLTYDGKKDSQELYFAGMVVMYLKDEYEEGTVLEYLSDMEDDEIPDPDRPGYVKEKWFEPEYRDKKLIDVTAVRDEEYHLLYFEFVDSTDNWIHFHDTSWDEDETLDNE